jgi:hypothetical protein
MRFAMITVLTAAMVSPMFVGGCTESKTESQSTNPITGTKTTKEETTTQNPVTGDTSTQDRTVKDNPNTGSHSDTTVNK